ncbi:MAG TPA: hypothetical protein DEF39_08820 [Hungateiclostridium thermocellum]|jgi:hypothetical protein|nr:hypothetical protein [Acetivibrio thermocellus]CDG35866.1 hypothetical protein CTHBC1_1217 [Acetivibrio thermocellus BC1]ADU74133.1 hypothetical protein Clo1313_1069 [Acetivibrio thermocellus DSM 1313]ALX08075.1 hypothetical protein AD2_01080 [Acetivibrio thermocellus AD2]ANV75822.1 hypothetical protein LQRI_1081 [Acetivibrio thermocellus DSM 2360]EIC06008.1 hypothetical protein YSBL_0400 [Acetivibrio thermocellus YS]
MPDSVTMANYNISFSGRVENPSDNTQTWIYRITKIGEPFPQINFWILVLCADPRHHVISSTGAGTVELGICPPCFSGITNTVMWKDLNNENVNGFYSFTITGFYEPADIPVFLSAGNTLNTGLITGPSCEPMESRKVKFYTLD